MNVHESLVIYVSTEKHFRQNKAVLKITICNYGASWSGPLNMTQFCEKFSYRGKLAPTMCGMKWSFDQQTKYIRCPTQTAGKGRQTRLNALWGKFEILQQAITSLRIELPRWVCVQNVRDEVPFPTTTCKLYIPTCKQLKRVAIRRGIPYEPSGGAFNAAHLC